MQDGMSFCPACGAQVGAAAPNAQHNASYNPQQAPASDAEANKGMAIIAYILFFVPLIAGAHKTSPFVKYHANQGTILFLTALAMGVVLNIVLAILGAIFLATFAFGLLGVFTAIFSLLYIFPVVLLVLGIVNAAGGKMKPLPVIGKFNIIK
jgi:uncharacterized membrane protein